MSWHEISITSPKCDVDTVTRVLEQEGALAITYKDNEDNPILEPNPQEITLWDKVISTGLFSLDANLEKISSRLHQSCPSSFIFYQPLEDKNWVTAWQEHFKPQLFGDTLWICPSETNPQDFEGTIVFLDPGLAFGTGQHATTRHCLEWLATHDLTGKTLIDFGCGTSILAISALKRGAQVAYGIDHDEQALLSSTLNAKKNQLPIDALKLSLGVEDTLPACDIVVANILMNPLLSLADTLADLCKPKGTLLLSGLLEDQSAAIIERYQTWFDFKPYCVDEEWILLVGTKRENAE